MQTKTSKQGQLSPIWQFYYQRFKYWQGSVKLNFSEGSIPKIIAPTRFKEALTDIRMAGVWVWDMSICLPLAGVV